MGKIQQRAAKSNRIKEPEIPQVSSNKQPPLFSFEYLDDKYSITQCDHAERSGFADTLRIMGKMTWEQLELTPRHGNGKENIPIAQIRGKKPPIITPDVDHVIAFRFHGTKPMVGHRIDRIFYIIWLDKDYTLYPHE